MVTICGCAYQMGNGRTGPRKLERGPRDILGGPGREEWDIPVLYIFAAQCIFAISCSSILDKKYEHGKRVPCKDPWARLEWDIPVLLTRHR